MVRQPALLTVRDAMARLGVSKSRVHQLIHAGRLTATKQGGAWWIDATALSAVQVRPRGWPAGRKRGASAAPVQAEAPEAMVLLSVRVVASRLGLSRQRVHQLIQAGQLSARRRGTTWGIPQEVLAAFMAQDHRAGRPRKAQHNNH